MMSARSRYSRLTVMCFVQFLAVFFGIACFSLTVWAQDVTPTAAGERQGFLFEGIPVFIELSKPLTEVPNTFETWIKVPRNVPDDTRVGIILGNYDHGRTDPSNINWEIYTRGNPRIWWNNGETQYVVTGVDLRNDTWTHLSFVRDEKLNRIYCYINGELVGIYAGSGKSVVPSKPHNIGSDRRALSGPLFHGMISEIRVWSTARTQEQIREYMHKELSGDEEGLLGYWKLRGDEKDVVYDFSPFENHGVIIDTMRSFWVQIDRSDEYEDLDSFSLAVIADTQYLSLSYPHMYDAITEWIRDNASKENVRFVLHLGDITESNTVSEWARASSSMSKLDGVVPYALTLGNHDYPNIAQRRDSSLFNQYFPLSKYESLPTFGGTFETDKLDNTYHFFSAGNEDYLVLALEFGPRDEVLEWASEVIEKHPDHKVIIITHTYVFRDGTRIGPGDESNPHHYGLASSSSVNDGEEMWNKLVRRHKNIFMVLSGHIIHPDVVVRIDKGDYGNDVYQMLVNPQGVGRGGEGLFLLMKFVPDADIIKVTYYSPFHDAYFKEVNQFYIDLNEAKIIPFNG